jgi:hypothetical protein
MTNFIALPNYKAESRSVARDRKWLLVIHWCPCRKKNWFRFDRLKSLIYNVIWNDWTLTFHCQAVIDRNRSCGDTSCTPLLTFGAILCTVINCAFQLWIPPTASICLACKKKVNFMLGVQASRLRSQHKAFSFIPKAYAG